VAQTSFVHDRLWPSDSNETRSACHHRYHYLHRSEFLVHAAGKKPNEGSRLSDHFIVVDVLTKFWEGAGSCDHRVQEEPRQIVAHGSFLTYNSFPPPKNRCDLRSCFVAGGDLYCTDSSLPTPTRLTDGCLRCSINAPLQLTLVLYTVEMAA